MNGYWNAIARAALDIPADADPRPRSRYESDAAFEGDELAVVEGASESPVDARTLNLPERHASSADQPEHDAPVLAPQATKATEPPAAALVLRANERPVEHVEARPTTESSDLRKDGGAADGAAPTMVLERTEHAEILRNESTHTIREVAAAPVSRDVDSDLPRTASDELPVSDSNEGQGALALPSASRSEAPETPVMTLAEPVTAPGAQVEREPMYEAPPPMVIEIDRVDIRIEHDRPAVVSAPAAQRVGAGDVPSLSDYLARRSGARA